MGAPFRSIIFYNYSNKFVIIFSFLVLSLFTACKVSVSLTGGMIDPRATTAYVGTFKNNAPLVNPSLSQDFTFALQTIIQNQTSLTLIDNANADYVLEGEIVNYTVTPVAIQGNDVAAMNRLTITVNVRFINKFDETQNFEQTFARYVDYNSSQSLSSIESSLVADINVALTDDIFNKSFVNW